MNYKVFNNHIQIDNTNGYTDIHDFLDAYYIPKKKQNILINSKKAYIDKKIYIYFDEEEIDWPISNKDVEVIYEDEFILVVHKDAGYIIHDKDDENCLNARVAHYYESNNMNTFVRPIHRLDKDTSGLVIYSKNSFFQPLLDKQIENKEIKRYYKAITKGASKANKEFIIDEPIGRNRHKSGTYIVSKTGKEAITRVKCLSSHNGYSLMECELETGRTHQIRVHLASKNYPIINDPIYGVKDKIIPYMGLWAYKVIIPHPITKELITIIDKERKDFEI